MKKIIIIFLFTLFTLNIVASEPIKIGIISDTHFLSEQLMDGGNATQNYVRTTARDIMDEPAILDSVLSDFIKTDIQVLLISGDITKDGEKKSHIDFVKKLKPLLDKGIKVFVIPGNHDIETGNEIGFSGNTKFRTENTSENDFKEIYKDCGYKMAISQDSASLSYAAELNKSTWLIAIDVARRPEFKRTGLPSEAISEQTERWIKDILHETTRRQIQVVGMMHWGLVEHFRGQAKYFPRYLVYDWHRLATLFADCGMKAIFTGHFHANDITSLTSKDGNVIYDIETGSLCSYPFAYRIANLYPDRMDVTTRNITSLFHNPTLGKDNQALLKQLATNIATNRLRDMGLGFDSSFTSSFAEIISQAFLLHVSGDEKMTDELQSHINALARVMDTDASDANITELDLPPADNNVTLKF